MRTALVLLAGLLASCAEPCRPAPEGDLGEPTEWEQAFIEGGGLPDSAAPEFLEAEDGLRLAYRDWTPTDWDGTGAVVLLLHGSSAYGELYAALGQEMAAQGVLVRIVDLRGHGLSACVTPSECGTLSPRAYADDGVYWPGRPGDAADESQHARDVDLHLEDLRARWPGARVVLMGHSSGAGLVSRVIEGSGMAGLDGAILLAPFNHSEQPQNELLSWDCGRGVGTAYAQVDLGALGDAMRSNPHRYVLDLVKNEDYQAVLDTERYTATTMFGLAVRDPDRFHAAFSGPTLWVAGEGDALLDVEASRREFAKLPGGSAFVIVTDTSHVGVTWSSGVARACSAFAKAPQAVLSGAIDP
ncbi:MAG: lysophospholipase [Nannocystaceae bacterium]|nr:lysophospholipase [Nannocystaceae bacterium]